jgi:Holliday junction resolvase RusA-like endonuclease
VTRRAPTPATGAVPEAGRVMRFTVPGDPHPWGVFTRYSKSPSKERLKAYQEHVQAVAKQAMAGQEPWSGPVTLTLVFNCPPKGYKKWDVTNLQKAAEDALKNIVMVDDKQVVMTFARKLQSAEPRTEIEAELSR